MKTDLSEDENNDYAQNDVSKMEIDNSQNSHASSLNNRVASAVFRSPKVHPMPTNLDSFSQIIEVRPSRSLRIYHYIYEMDELSSNTEGGANKKEMQQTVIFHQPETSQTTEYKHFLNFSCSNDNAENTQCDKNHQQSDDMTNPSNTGLSDGRRLNSLGSSVHAKVTETSEKRSRTASSVRFNIACDVSQATVTNIKPRPRDTVFLLHGVGGSVDIWNLQIKFLHKLNYEIIAFDFVGHGQSCCPREEKAYTFDQISDDVIAVFDKFCKFRNVVIGHSYGCCFAVRLARYRPRFITKLILISGGSPIALEAHPGILCLPIYLLNCCHKSLTNIVLKRSFYFNGHDQSTYKSAFNIQSYVLKYIMKGQDWPEGNIDFHSWLTTPTLLLHGKHDHLISTPEVNLMNKTIPGSQLVIIEDAGHMVMMEKSDQVNQLIFKFLTESSTTFNGKLSSEEL